ncbi:hypothetical protein T265_03123 [Opisthorchis viverrini]|uniref:Sulfotransferase domain protein n=1 Tax=Opisthorchis viverrini TaxID=6198 RepID=A0A075A4K3_OPIVI|nr:hypothetical protein T265_03123 [Opisthorchis viverrini]KER30515.1 hypothetical protein T265_03123 [Opisthorchis viverrini]
MENEDVVKDMGFRKGEKTEKLNPSCLFPGLSASGHRSSEKSKLLVIGVGLMRTGTTSLKKALEMLYDRPCYHMSDVFGCHKEAHIKAWLWAFDQTAITAGHIPREFWDAVYGNCCAAIDYPTCAFYKQLMDVYPEAKPKWLEREFTDRKVRGSNPTSASRLPLSRLGQPGSIPALLILTARAPTDWLKSCRATMLSADMLKKPTFGDRLTYWRRGILHLPELHHTMFARTLGSEYRTMTDGELITSYSNWINEVERSVDRNRLLIFQPEAGWGPLCKFLNLPQPDITYPHLNKRDLMVGVLTELINEGKLIEKIILCLAATLVCAISGALLRVTVL